MAAAPVLLLVGPDSVGIRTRLGQLRDGADGDGAESYEAGRHNAQTVVDSCRMPSLFAANKLVIVHGVDAFKVDDVNTLIDYIAAPEEGVQLVMTAASLRKDSRLAKACGKAPAQTERFDGPEPKQVVANIMATASELGGTIDKAGATRLVELFTTVERRQASVNTARVDSELRRLLSWAGTDTITRPIVDQHITPEDDAVVFALADAWASRDRGTLLALTERLFQQGEDPTRLAMLLVSHIQLVHSAARLLEAGYSGDGVTKELGVHPFRAKRCVQQAQSLLRGSNPKRVRALLDASFTRAALLEAEMKGSNALASTQDAAKAAFERALCELV
jgi:DNA polymerase-3 subunit delta